MIGKKIQELEFNIKKKLTGDFFGIYKTSFKGQGIDFVELREYVFGDPIKNIDRNASAKYSKLYTKLYEQERDLNVLILLDIGKTMRFTTEKRTKIDILEDVFFMLSMCVNKSNDNLGVLLYDDVNKTFFDFKKGQENVVKTIKFLQEHKFSFDSNLAGGLEYVRSLKVKDSLVFILTDDISFDRGAFQILNEYNEIIYVNIFDYYENNISKNYSLNLGYKNQLMLDFFPFFGELVDFKNLRLKKLNKLKFDLKKIQIDYIKIDNHTDVFREFYKLFYQRGKY